MFNPFLNPFCRKNMGQWRVEDLVSPLQKPNQPHQVGELTLHLDFPQQRKSAIPRVLGHCDMCLVDVTPLWRGGPNGSKTLCNACGIRYSKELKKVQLVLGDQKAGKPSSTGEKAEPSKGTTSSSQNKFEKPKETKQATKKKQH